MFTAEAVLAPSIYNLLLPLGSLCPRGKDPMTRLRWSVALPTDHVDGDPTFITAAGIARMASALEDAGVDACHVTDHPFPSAAWVQRGGHHALDPLVTLAVAAGATQTILLHTNVFVAAYRHPVLAAHGLATLDAVSGGRLVLGVAVGYLESEFEALGIDFHRRGALLDQAVERMKQLWSGEPDPDGNVVRPRPACRPHPPVWFGGNSNAAIRRVAASGQGWMPFPASARLASAVRTSKMADFDDLRRGIDRLRFEVESVGRTDQIDVCCTPFSHPHHLSLLQPEALLEESLLLAQAGVTWISMRLPAPSVAGYLENVDRFASEVLTTENDHQVVDDNPLGGTCG